MNIRVLFFGLITIITLGCYQDPFFKLKVSIIDQDLVPVASAEVIVSVQDENGVIIDSANVYKTGLTDLNGEVLFEFENLGFFNVDANKVLADENNQICGSASVSLEENMTKEIPIMITESNCN